VNIKKAAVKVGSRHGSVIPVLAENPNHPEEQSAVVMCGQSLQTRLSGRELTSAPITNTGLSLPQHKRTGRQRHRQTHQQAGNMRPDSSHCNDVTTSKNISQIRDSLESIAYSWSTSYQKVTQQNLITCEKTHTGVVWKLIFIF